MELRTNDQPKEYRKGLTDKRKDENYTRETLEKQMPRPACAPQVLSAPLFLESVYEKKSQKYRQSFKQFGSVGPDLGPHCLQTKNWQGQCPPPIPWRKSLELHVNGTRGSSQGVQVHWQMLYFCLSTHGLLRSYEEGTTALSLMQRHVLALFFFNYFIFVCGGKGPVTSLTFRNSRGVQHILSRRGGGGGASNFFPRGWSPIAKR